jgi:hypothetical protein
MWDPASKVLTKVDPETAMGLTYVSSKKIILLHHRESRNQASHIVNSYLTGSISCLNEKPVLLF